jgi:hypothetical protein
VGLVSADAGEPAIVELDLDPAVALAEDACGLLPVVHGCRSESSSSMIGIGGSFLDFADYDELHKLS